MTDKISKVADDSAARTLWAAEQERLYASLTQLRVGAPRPDMPRRDPHALRFVVPVLLAVAFTVGWGEWLPRLGEAFSPVRIIPVAVAARIDAWVDPPPYTRQAPVFLSRRADAAATSGGAAAAPLRAATASADAAVPPGGAPSAATAASAGTGSACRRGARSPSASSRAIRPR